VVGLTERSTRARCTSLSSSAAIAAARERDSARGFGRG
jgi:hypothetical protein